MRCSSVGMRSVLALVTALGLLALGAPSAFSHKLEPPPWWNDGRALIEKRGGRCERSTMRQPPPGVMVQVQDPDTGQLTPRGSYTEESIQCTSANARCGAIAQESDDPAKRKFDEYSYLCRFLSGTDSKLNKSEWLCQREKSRISLGQGETTDEQAWTARKTKLFPENTNATLAGCLAPKVALDEPNTPSTQARRSGVKLPVTCSYACKVSVTGGARSVSRKLSAGRRTVLRIPVRRAVTKLRLTVSAAGYRARATVRATTRGGTVRLNAPDVLSLKR